MSENDGRRFSKKKFSLKTFFWTPTESPVSKSTLENFLTTDNTPGNFRWMSENNKKNRFVKEKVFPQIFILDFVGELSIDDPGEIFLLGSRNLLLIV